MVNQDQNHYRKSNQERQKEQATPQGSHKKKALENQKHQEREFVQESKFQYVKQRNSSKKSPLFQGFDHNEGQQHSQKS